ncbi:hypothetical protein [Glycomyces sp. TRM65418]|nr:hypothetical protein [Glycomyces sp. TRM65418]
MPPIAIEAPSRVPEKWTGNAAKSPLAIDPPVNPSANAPAVSAI